MPWCCLWEVFYSFSVLCTVVVNFILVIYCFVNFHFVLHCVDWNNLLSQLCFDCTTITGYKVTFTSANEGAIDTKTLPVLFALKDYLQKYLIHLYMFIEKKNHLYYRACATCHIDKSTKNYQPQWTEEKNAKTHKSYDNFESSFHFLSLYDPIVATMNGYKWHRWQTINDYGICAKHMTHRKKYS